jgi:hypothetical protein
MAAESTGRCRITFIDGTPYREQWKGKAAVASAAKENQQRSNSTAGLLRVLSRPRGGYLISRLSSNEAARSNRRRHRSSVRYRTSNVPYYVYSTNQ